jgi:hypothetical protein
MFKQSTLYSKGEINKRHKKYINKFCILISYGIVLIFGITIGIICTFIIINHNEYNRHMFIQT